MEEHKNCAEGGCDKCKMEAGCAGKCCGHHHKCCHMIMKIIVGLVLIGIGYCAGTMAVGRSQFRGWEGGPRFMDKVYNTQEAPLNSASGSATVNVLPQEKSVSTKTPPVLE